MLLYKKNTLLHSVFSISQIVLLFSACVVLLGVPAVAQTVQRTLNFDMPQEWADAFDQAFVELNTKRAAEGLPAITQGQYMKGKVRQAIVKAIENWLPRNQWPQKLKDREAAEGGAKQAADDALAEAAQ